MDGVQGLAVELRLRAAGVDGNWGVWLELGLSATEGFALGLLTSNWRKSIVLVFGQNHRVRTVEKHTRHFVFVSELAGKTANGHGFQFSVPFEGQSDCGSRELSRDMNSWFGNRECGVVDHSIDSAICDSYYVYRLWIEMLLCNGKVWRKRLALKRPQMDP